MRMAKTLSAVKPIQNHVKTISHLAIRFMASSEYTTLVDSSNFNNHMTSKWKPRNSISPMHLSTTSTNHQIQNKDHSSASSSSAIGYCNGNPCLDFFLHVVIPSLEWKYKYTLHKWKKPEESTALVKYLLPLAWSHNPLTALKLICNLQQEEFYCQEFLWAAYWLQQNHPKTLLSNVNTLAKSFGCFDELIEILHLLVVRQDKKKGEEKTPDVAKKAENMYETDPVFKLLHDHIAEVFAECLKSDLDQLKKQKSKASVVDPLEFDDERYGNEQCFEEVTFAALSCLRRYSDARNVCTNLLKNSIASKVFPRESYPEYQGLDEEDYMNRVWNRLKIEFLMPLDKYYRWYDGWSSEEPMSDVDKYLKEVKAGKSKIVADAMLPNEIISYLDHWDFGKVAELQWKAMVENMRIQGKKTLNSCLAVCDERCFTDARGSKEVSAGLTLLVSELNQDPCWKGNLICHLRASKEPFNDSTKTDLQLIRGGDLRYKCEFLRRTNRTWKPFVAVLDFLLQVALDENLKPERMIKKVLVFGGQWDADRFNDSCWEADYKKVQRKYKEKGYGDKVPQIVYWQLSKHESLKPVLPRTQPGVTILRGFSNALVKLFLENDGEIRAEHYMELSISGKGYESLSVVD